MIKVKLSNEILNLITEINENKYKTSSIKMTRAVINKFRKNSKRKSSYASNKIEGNPLTQEQAEKALDKDERRHLLAPEQEIRNYMNALNYLEDKRKANTQLSLDLLLDVQSLVCSGNSKEKIGLRKPTPPGVLFAVYDSVTGEPDYIPPEAKDISELIDELIYYVKTTDDHPLIVAAIIHYQLVTIHPFEDGNGRCARLLSGYYLDLNGYGFNGIGSLEEYFAYDVGEYYDSLQMSLPVVYYEGRDNPPHPEIWIGYFLRMVLLYSSKVTEIASQSQNGNIEAGLSYLNANQKALLKFIIKAGISEFKPIEISNKLSCTNRTVINRLKGLCENGFVEPVLVNERVCSYRVSDFTKSNSKQISKSL